MPTVRLVFNMWAIFVTATVLLAPVGAAVIGLSTDIEDCESNRPGGCDPFLLALRNVSAQLHTGPAQP